MQYGAQGSGPVSLPSGLGAGGRGKEKAPCRYLHFEVDWDVNDGQGLADQRVAPRRKPYRLKLGLGPEGKETTPVRRPARLLMSMDGTDSAFPVTAAVDQLRLAQIRLLGVGQVPCHHGRPAMGHPHERTFYFASVR